MLDSDNTASENNQEWRRQPGESEIAYHYFRQYLMLKPPRKYTTLADKMDMHVQTFRQYGMKFNWRERAALYDDWNAAEFDEDRQKVVAAYQEKVVAEGVDDYKRVRDIWLNMVEELEEAVAADKIDDPAEIVENLQKLVRTRDNIDKMARRAVQLPTTYTSSEQKTEISTGGAFYVEPGKPAKQLPEELDDE